MPPYSEDNYDESAIPALLSLSAKLRNHEAEKRKRNRKVHFAPQPQVAFVDYVPGEYRPLYWMSRKEFDDIKRNCALTVEQAKLDPSSTYTRGLESSLMKADVFLQTYLHRRGAIRSVMKEQTMQYEAGYTMVKDIAEQYAPFSKTSLEKAHTRALQDELALRK